MTARGHARHVWFARAARRRAVLAVTAAVLAVAVAAVVVAEGLGGAAAAARADQVTDARVASASVAVARTLDGLAAGAVAVLAVVAVAVLLGLLAAVRTDEDALLVARGASTGQRARWAAAEGAVVGLLGALLGAAVGIAVCASTVPASSIASDTARTTGAAVAVALLVSVVSAAVAGSRRPRPSAPAARTTVLVVVTAVALAAAAFVVWRLFVAGVPVRSTAGHVEVDPVAVAAPLVVVAAGAVVVLLAGGLTARIVAARAGRWSGFLPALTARRVARQWSTVAPSVLVVAAVVATGVLVAGLATTTTRVDEATVRAVVGPDVRVTTPGDDIVDEGTPVVPVLRGLPHASAAVPVLSDEAGIGSVTVPLLALPGRVATSVLPGGTAQAVSDLASDTPPVGLALPTDAGRVTVTVAVGTPTLAGRDRADAVGAVAPTAWVVDADGRAAALPLRTADGGPVTTGARAATSASLPGTGGPWRLLAVEPTLTFSSRPADADGADGTERLHVPVRVRVDGSTSGDAAASGTADVVDLGDPVRIPLGGTPSARTFPVVVTAPLADRLALSTGARFDLVPGTVRSAVHARVARIVSDVPGTGSTEAVAADLPALVALAVAGGPAIEGTDAGVPRVDETWLASSDPRATAAAARSGIPRGSTVRTADGVRSTPVVDTAVLTLAGAAVVGLLFAMLVLAVGAGRRDGSGPVFAGVGVAPARHLRVRIAELGLPLLAAVVGGTAVGMVAVAVTVAPFAVAAVPDARGLVVATPVVGPVAWVVPVVALVLGAAVVVLGALRTTRPTGVSS